MSNPKIILKFEKFLILLEDLQKTTTWVQMFRWRRAMVIGMNLLRNILILLDFSTYQSVQVDFETIKFKLQKAFLYVTIYTFYQVAI